MIVTGIFAVSAQVDTKPKAETNKPTAKASPTPDSKLTAAQKALTAEQAIETALVFTYAYPGGRKTLDQIRKTTLERGRSKFTAADGKVDSASYQRFILRGETLNKERIRVDQEFPNARYSLVFAEEKIYGVFNNSVFTPREDASRAFENQIVHGLDALLRYKEDGSKVEMGEREKVMGVDYYIINLTDKKENKTRYYMSAKTFRVMMLTYEDGGIQYKRKFYDYNIAQGTLVPYRTVLWAGEKIVEETDIGTVTYGQKIDEDMFKNG